MWRKRKEIVTEEDQKITDRGRARERTMNRAVRLLAAKPRSVAELRERLLEKSWTDPEIVDGVIERLKEYKYLDDQQFADSLAASKLVQKPQGKRRLQQRLGQKKLDKEIVERAIASAYEKMPERDLIDSVISKRVRLKGHPTSRDDVKKLYDHLLRLGFSFDLIREKVSIAVQNCPADGESA